MPPNLMRHSFIRMGLLLSLLLVLMACNSPLPVTVLSTPSPVPTPSVRILKLWHALPSQKEPFLQKIADQWSEQQKEKVKIELERSNNEEELHQKLRAAIQTGMPPAMAFVRPPDIADYVDSDALLPLSPLIDEAGTLNEQNLADYYSQFFDSVRYPKANNGLYAWPIHRYQTLLFLNQTNFKKIGGNLPPTSWDDLVASCGLYIDDGAESCFGVYPTGPIAVLWIWAHNGTIVNEAGNAPTFQGEGGQAVMRWLAALRAVNGVYAVQSDEEKVEAFVNGKTLFTFESTEALSNYEKRIDDSFQMLAIAPPSETGIPVTVATGANVAIFRNQKEIEKLAWAFVQYWTDTETNYQWAKEFGAYPVRRSVLEKLIKEWPNSSPLRQAAKWLPSARSEPLLAEWPKIEQALASAMLNTINGSETPEEALNEAARKTEGYLSR